jgi:hypothetical protein
MSKVTSGLAKTAIALAATFAISATAAQAGEQLPLTRAPAVKPGVAAATCVSWCAAINADGSIDKAHKFTTASHLATGIYQVNFYTSVSAQKNISACVWTATPGYGTFSGDLGPTFVTTAGRVDTTNAVWVHTYDSAGATADEPFLLIVSC